MECEYGTPTDQWVPADMPTSSQRVASARVGSAGSATNIITFDDKRMYIDGFHEIVVKGNMSVREMGSLAQYGGGLYKPPWYPGSSVAPIRMRHRQPTSLPTAGWQLAWLYLLAWCSRISYT